jgi:hypothetical protein
MKKVILILAGAAILGSSAFGQVLLNPGATTPIVPNIGLGPGAVIDSRIDNFTGLDVFNNVAFTGRMESAVLRRPSGRLTFLYRFVNLGGGFADPIERVAMSSFAGYATEVAQTAGLALGAPVVLATAADRSANARTVGFDFFGNVPAGSNSSMLWIDTNAFQYQPGAVAIINGGVATVQAFAPVPEPATMAALGLGVAALIRRRRTK